MTFLNEPSVSLSISSRITRILAWSSFDSSSSESLPRISSIIIFNSSKSNNLRIAVKRYNATKIASFEESFKVSLKTVLIGSNK